MSFIGYFLFACLVVTVSLAIMFIIDALFGPIVGFIAAVALVATVWSWEP